jgi:hypothetical protein
LQLVPEDAWREHQSHSILIGKGHVFDMQQGPCAFVFQNPDNQIVMPTVASEVALGTGEQKLTNEEVSKRVFAVLEKVNMTEFAEVSTGTLSGGQKQRTAIAAALAQGPPTPQVCCGCFLRSCVSCFSMVIAGRCCAAKLKCSVVHSGLESMVEVSCYPYCM